MGVKEDKRWIVKYIIVLKKNPKVDDYCSHKNMIFCMVYDLKFWKKNFMILKYRYKELINFICKLFLPLFSDYAKMKPSLFSRYLPTVLPSTSVHDLEQYIAETRQMQEDMKMIPEFRGYDIPDTIKSTVYQNGNHLTFVLIEEKCTW